MKTYKEFINEALAGLFVKTVAKQVFKNRGVAKAARNVIKQSTNAPKQLKFTKLYHGTNTPASAAISKGGYRTDKNVTRQMLGKGVYTSPDNYSAAGYGIRASRKYGGEPAMRQLRVPQQIAKKQTTTMRYGTGDYSGKGYKMTTLSTQQANKYDVTDKLPKDKFDVKGPLMSPEKKRELRRRVRRGLKQKAGREQLSREIAKDKKNFGVQIYKDRINNAKRLKKMLRMDSKEIQSFKQFTEQLAQEQLVVPRSIKKKNPLMTVKTEMDILKQLSNRKAVYDRARTGKPMYPFSEDNKHRDAKLNYQYKDVTNPKKPVDPVRALKLKKA